MKLYYSNNQQVNYSYAVIPKYASILPATTNRYFQYLYAEGPIAHIKAIKYSNLPTSIQTETITL